MKVRSARIQSSPKLMIIPMIDIIFFLLVFFMMNTLDMIHQKTLPIDLPQAKSVQQADNLPLSVTILADGRISMEETIVSFDELSQNMIHRIHENKDSVVVLRADKIVEHGRVVEVMDILKEAGVKKLAIATEKKGS